MDHVNVQTDPDPFYLFSESPEEVKIARSMSPRFLNYDAKAILIFQFLMT